MKPFYMVCRVGYRGPKHQHENRELAMAEAERLSALEPKAAFVVLEVVAAAVKCKWVELE